MVRRARRLFAVSLPMSVVAITLLLAANLALAQQPERQAAGDTPHPVSSANEAYRKGKEFAQNKNYAEAMRWYRTAADQGNADAQLALGNLYGQGQGVPQDNATALLWFRKAADQGNLEAENDVGFFYLTGMGAAQNYVEAMRWLRKAADQGNEVSQRNIGMMYLNGLGVPQNRDEAIRWFRMAAAKGDEDSKEALQALGAK